MCCFAIRPVQVKRWPAVCFQRTHNKRNTARLSMDLPSNREGDTFNDTTSLLEAANFISKKVNVKAVILSVAVVWIFCVSIYLSTHTYEIWPASHLENSKIPLLDGKNQSCPRQPPPVDILELRQKVSKLLWENVDPMADYIMLVSAPRPHRPESDLLLPGYRYT